MREHINGLDKLCFIAYFCKKLQITLESFYFTGNVDYLFGSEFAQGFNKLFCCACSWRVKENCITALTCLRKLCHELACVLIIKPDIVKLIELGV